MERGFEVTSQEEFQRELCKLFEAASQGGVELGAVSTCVCQSPDSPDRELLMFELEERSE